MKTINDFVTPKFDDLKVEGLGDIKTGDTLKHEGGDQFVAQGFYVNAQGGKLYLIAIAPYEYTGEACILNIPGNGWSLAK